MSINNEGRMMTYAYLGACRSPECGESTAMNLRHSDAGSCGLNRMAVCYPLVMSNIAMENGP